ncbi:MAG TPA: Ig-like domain-containing protein [Xanthomonadaceae bacterium]|nr:Ig-like domain-containing protein [Xanthomonadaceae bacterium]
MRKPAIAISVSLLVAGLAPPPAAAININLNSQHSFPLLTADYDPAARRLSAQSEIGNIECATGGEAIPPGTYSLRLDGQDYRLTDLSIGQQVFRYDTNDRTFQANLTRLEELIGSGCESSGVSAANLRLQIDSEPTQRIGQGVIYRTAAPRRLEVRIVDPLICFDYGGGAGALRLDLTDVNGDFSSFAGVTLAQYVHGNGLLRIGMPPTASCFGFGEGGAQGEGGGVGGSPDLLFASSYEIEEIYPDLVLTLSELPSATFGLFRYRIEVANVAIGAADNIRIRDLFPKIGEVRFIDSLIENWNCTAFGVGSSCGAVNSGTGRLDLVGAALPRHIPGAGAPPRLVIDVERAYADFDETLLGGIFSIQAAVTTSPPGLPDRNRADNSANLQAVVSEPAGPIARDDEFGTDQDTSTSGNLFADNGHGADEHAAGQSFWVGKVNGDPISVGAPVVIREAPGDGIPATVTVQSNGSMDFDPGEAFISVPGGGSAMETFTYTLTDVDNLESTATVTISVTGFNDPPVGGDMTYEVPVGGLTVSDPALGVLAASVDPDGDPLSVVAVDGATLVGGAIFLPSGGVLFMNANGTFNYALPGASPGQGDSFSITISDGEFTDVARITIQIVP